MTRNISLLIIFAICNITFGQKQSTTELKINDLIRIWKYSSKPNSNYLVFYKISSFSKDHNARTMEFLSDGTMITRLSIGTKKCGNDRSSNLSIGGNWNVDKRNNILSLTNGKFNSTEYRILASSSNKLIIKRIIAEEKL